MQLINPSSNNRSTAFNTVAFPIPQTSANALWLIHVVPPQSPRWSRQADSHITP